MRHFIWITVGLLLLVVDVPVRGIDVAPDVLGYLIIAVALGGAWHVARSFGIAQIGAVLGVPAATVLMLNGEAVPILLILVGTLVNILAWTTMMLGLGFGMRQLASHDHSLELHANVVIGFTVFGSLVLLGGWAVYLLRPGIDSGTGLLIDFVTTIPSLMAMLLAAVLVYRSEHDHLVPH